MKDLAIETIPPAICVVRLKTSAWHDKRGLYNKQSLTYMKRLSVDGWWIGEDIDNVGALDMFPRIVNLPTCADGLYVIVTCNESRDYETGLVDDYDYQLVPYTKPQEGAL